MLRTRLEKAREDYVEKYIDLFSNGESLEYDHIFELYDAYVNQFLQELYIDEDETARMIARGGWFDEINFLKPIFDHFKSVKIYEAIKTNCEHAFNADEEVAEPENFIEARKELIKYMQKILNI